MSAQHVTLRSERLVLDPITVADAPALTEILQDERFSRTTSVPHPYTRHMAEEHLAKSAEKWKQGSADFAIRSADASRLLGRIELRSSTRFPDSAELSFLMRTEEWGRGLMTEAVGAVIDYAFTTMGLTRLDWYAHVGNWGSWKPVWRNGFVREGVRRRRDEPDLWSAGLIASDPRTPRTPWDGPGPGRGPALDSSRPKALVEQFHRTYSMPNRLASGEPATVDYERVTMRMSLIFEELCELVEAVYGARARKLVEAGIADACAADDSCRDVVEAADALADLVYVIYGMAIESGIDLDAVLAEVQASNLSKLMPDGSVKLREDGKVLKGPNFFPPNIPRALGRESEGERR